MKPPLEGAPRCVACHHSRRPAPRDEVLAVCMVGKEPLCAFHAAQVGQEQQEMTDATPMVTKP